MRQNTINSWNCINSLWNKWIIKRIYCANSHVNLNNFGASSIERKCHRRYYINIFVSAYLSFNWLERLAIDKSGSRPMEKKLYRRLLSIFKSRYLKYSKFLESEHRSELSISNEMWQHVFRSGVGSYIFTFLGYVPGLYFFLLVCVNYPLTLKRGRFRNILSIDSRLNRINPSTNIIFPPNAERGYRTKFEIIIEVVFQYSIE